MDNKTKQKLENLSFDLEMVKSIKTWFLDHVLTVSTFVELASILVVSGLTFFASKYLLRLLQGYFRRRKNQWIPKSVKDIIGQVFYPAILALTLGILSLAADDFGLPNHFIRTFAYLVGVWSIIRTSSVIVKDAILARIIAVIAWFVMALLILGIQDDTATLLDRIAFDIGDVHISALSIIRAGFSFVFILWLAINLSRLVEKKLDEMPNIDASVKVLFSKLFKIFVIAATIWVALNIAGIDMTALTVFSGAVGVGLGFGLQKIFSNFISGLILLVDKSIKPGDVVSLGGDVYGWVNSLSARCVSVLTRDGEEHLIPNEIMITDKVVNWSYTHKRVRLRLPFGVSYNADINHVIDIVPKSIEGMERILKNPTPLCLITGFGDNSVDLELRFWINDPARGITNIKGDVYLALWNTLQEHNIEIPFPQRDLHLKSTSGDVKDALKEIVREVISEEKKKS